MANEWYYAKDGQQLGPVSAKELKRLADAGQLGGGDLVWKEGMPDWKPAGDVKGLIGSAPAAGGGQVASSGGSASPRRRSRYRSPTGQVLLMIAGVVLIGQMCVPWWSMALKNTESESDTNGNGNVRRRDSSRGIAGLALMMNMSDDQLRRVIDVLEKQKLPESASDERRRQHQLAIKFVKIAKQDRKWWKEHLKTSDKSFVKRFTDEVKEIADSTGSTATLRIWGWNEGIGIMGLVFGIVIIVLAIVFVSVPPMRNWSWIVSIIATIMGIIVLIFALIWIFTAPGKDASPEFRQGMIIGPFMFLGGGVMFLLVGIFDMIFGLSFMTRMRRLKAQR